MKFLAVAAALISVVPALAQDQLTVNTVTGIVQCQPIQFTWSGGTPPYFLSLIPAGQPSAAAIKQFPTQDGTTFTWNVDLPSGSTFTVSLKDSVGATAFSDIETVNSGPDSSCLNASDSVTETGSSGGSATSGATGATSAPPASATNPSSASNGASSGASARPTSGANQASGSATPSATGGSNDSGALALTANTFGIAGLMGLIGAALF